MKKNRRPVLSLSTLRPSGYKDLSESLTRIRSVKEDPGVKGHVNPPKVPREGRVFK